MDADKIQGGFGEKVMRIESLLRALVLRERHLAIKTAHRVIAPKVVGVVIVSVSLVQIPNELLKPFLLGNAGGVLVAQAPFADERSVVTSLLQHLPDGEILRTQRDLSIPPDQGVAGV